MNTDNWQSMTEDTYTLSLAIQSAKDGKIAAIKSLRFIVKNESVLGLKEAKDIVENIMSLVPNHTMEIERLHDEHTRLKVENGKLRTMLAKTLNSMPHEQLVNVVLGML